MLITLFLIAVEIFLVTKEKGVDGRGDVEDGGNFLFPC